jgi:methionyl-tRNA formyltransferase
MHPTLLPSGRGRAPIPWTIIKGLDQTGVTAFLLEEEADSGGIVLQEAIQISLGETATSLFAKCATAHQLLGRRLASILASKSLTWVEQDASLATVWPRRRPQDGLIHFGESVYAIDRLVRALAPPYPGAFFYYEGRRIAVNQVEVLVPFDEAPAGSIVAVSNSGMPTIAAADGAIRCITLGSDCADVRFTIGVPLDD